MAVVLVISPVRIWIDYRHRGMTEDSLLLQISLLWDARTFSVRVPVISSSPSGVAVQAEAGQSKGKFKLSMPSIQQLKQNMAIIKELKGNFSWLFRFIRKVLWIKQLVWHTEIGLNDSARLAQIAGGLWAVKGTVSAAGQKIFQFSKQPVLRIRPYFNRSYFRTVFTCILEFRLGYIIIVAFFAVFLVLKLKLAKRGENNVGTSNSRLDEDSNGKYQRNGRRQYSHR